MKLRCLPEDFQVEELTEFRSGPGPFSLYRLEKRSLGTPEAVEAILRRWRLPRAVLSCGGLKDRHACTAQHLTIRHGPRRHLHDRNFHLRYLGPAPRAFSPGDIAANSFRLVIRDLSEAEAQRAAQQLPLVQHDGIPNYFDDQRFGSLGRSGQFVAHAWCLGDYERALWLALADPNAHDRPQQREAKRLLRQHWGDWSACCTALPRSHARSIVTYLAQHPTDFRGAVARLRRDLRTLYVAAFQSYLWNRLLAEALRQQIAPPLLSDVPLHVEPVPFFGHLPEALRQPLHALQLPLPAARSRHEAGPWLPVLERILAGLGLQLRQLRIKYPRDTFFSKGHRAACVCPTLDEHAVQPDDLHPGRHQLLLAFRLPRGSYATILVKRLFALQVPAADPSC
jgi:tRNA pseudouridine13 synthase